MPRTPSPTLTEAELRLMNVLWEKGPATVGEVAAALPREPPLAYSTVLTTLRILERKGYIRHIKEGRAFVYQALVDRGQASRSAVRHLIGRFFRNSPELLVLNLLESEDMDKRELKRLKTLIQEAE